DGIVLTAALPPRFGFVIKREMATVPLAGAVLRRLGSEFVERFNRQRGAADARRVLRNASNGHSLVFFPEGTFTRTPGLLKFHTGAFATAMRAGCPVVPAVVRGTRRAFPAEGRRVPGGAGGGARPPSGVAAGRRPATPGCAGAADPHAPRLGRGPGLGPGAARPGARRDPHRTRRARSHMLRRYCPPT